MSRNILRLIDNHNAGREKKALIYKYQAMIESPFRFFRGTCHLFYTDLLNHYPFQPSPKVWLCGDLHIENYGSFKGANRLVYFDMGDFDESIQGPLLWDLSRLITSVELAGIELKFSSAKRKKLMNLLLDEYKLRLIAQKAIAIENQVAQGLIKELFDQVISRKEKSLLKKRVQNNSLIKNEKLLSIPNEEKKKLISSFETWLHKNILPNYQVLDVGYRIAGTGSIGVKRYLFLIVNKKKSGYKLLMDVKEAIPSSLSWGGKQRQPKWIHESERIIHTQSLLQQVAPAFLSSFQFQQKWYTVKELQPTTDKINIELLKKYPEMIDLYLKNLGMITSSAHLRGSGRMGTASADELKKFVLSDHWKKGLIEWSVKYAEQVKKDYQTFCEAHKRNYFS